MGLFGKKHKEENEILRAQIEELSALMTPELSELANVKKKLQSKNPSRTASSQKLQAWNTPTIHSPIKSKN